MSIFTLKFSLTALLHIFAVVVATELHVCKDSCLASFATRPASHLRSHPETQQASGKMNVAQVQQQPAVYVHRFGDHVVQSAPFWQEVQKREEGAVITLLKCKTTGQTILAGQFSKCNTSVSGITSW